MDKNNRERLAELAERLKEFTTPELCDGAGLPVFAKGLTCRTAGKSGAGAVNVPVCCGGVTVNPGDIIAGDRNGVVVLRPDETENVMARAMEKRLRQEAVIKKMRETGEVMPRIPKKMENR